MKTDRPFFDTNVLLYLLSEDSRKADRAEAIIATGGIISVQVLNEFASVASRKLKMTYAEIRDALLTVRAVCQTQAVTINTHELGLDIAERFGFSLYDSMIRQFRSSIRMYYFVFGRYAARSRNRWSIGDYKPFSGLIHFA